MLWTKRTHQGTVFRLFGAQIKFHPIPHAIFETARSGFIQILPFCSVSWKITSLYFFNSTFIYFGQKWPIEVTFSDFWLVRWQFTKFLMSYLKPQARFSLNFASLFSVMEDKSSVLFYLKRYMIFTKGTHHSAKFQISDCSGEISPNLYFDRLLLLKVYKVSAKKSMEEICLMTPKSGAKFEERLIFCSKMTRIWWTLIRALESLKNFHFDWSLLCKVYNFWPKKVRRSYISWHWRVMQNLKKNWLVVCQMTWGIW